MDDVSKLGPLWVAQLTKEVARHRNHATESLLTINPEGDFAKQHQMLIDAANAMLAAPQLVAALREAEQALASCYNVTDWPASGHSSQDAALATVRAALAAAGAQP